MEKSFDEFRGQGDVALAEVAGILNFGQTGGFWLFRFLLLPVAGDEIGGAAGGIEDFIDFAPSTPQS